MYEQPDKIEGEFFSLCPTCREGCSGPTEIQRSDSFPLYACSGCGYIYAYSVSALENSSTHVFDPQSIGNRIKRVFNILCGRAV